MKNFILPIILFALCGLFATAQDDCNADAGIAILPQDCIENFGTTLPITEFEVAPSGTTTYEFVFTAPVVNDTVERVIGVNNTGEFDFSLDTLTNMPFAPGDYGVTIFAYNSEDLYDLTTNPAVTIFECIEGNGEETLAEVLTCIQSLGLIMNTLTIDLVIENVLESFAPVLLMHPMCYDFSEKQIITVVDGATDSCMPIGIERISTAPPFHYDSVNNTLHLFDLDSNEIQNVILSNINGARLNNFAPANKVRLPSLASGIYILDFVTEKGRVARQIAVY